MQSSIKNVESGEDTPKPLILIMFITTLIVSMAAFGIKKIIMDKKSTTKIIVCIYKNATEQSCERVESYLDSVY